MENGDDLLANLTHFQNRANMTYFHKNPINGTINAQNELFPVTVGSR